MEEGKPQTRIHASFFIILGLIVGIVIKLFIVDVFFVSGTSMESTIAEGSLIAVSKLAYGIVNPFGADLCVRWASPKQDDVVIYRYNNRVVVKRCVAIAGDALEIDASSNVPSQVGREYRVAVNGRTLSLDEHQYQRIKHSTAVPAGMIFAVGDNDAESIDSRNYGFVAVENILGKVLCQ